MADNPVNIENSLPEITDTTSGVKNELIFATLGNVEFLALQGFATFESATVYPWVEHIHLAQHPSLQLVGLPPRTINFDMRLHLSIAPPESSLQKLRDIANSNKSVSLVFGSKYVGKFVIKTVTETVRKTLPGGRLLLVDVAVSLLEDNPTTSQSSNNQLTENVYQQNQHLTPIGSFPKQKNTAPNNKGGN